MRTALILSVAFLSVIPASSALHAGSRIEAVKGRVYTISKEHGPWMIMVASFSRVRSEEAQAEGLSPREAAQELVYQLRKAGIPAYVFEQEGKVGHIETENRNRQRENRIYAAQRGMICVLAGNYRSAEEEVAKRTLEYIKKDFNADFLIELGGRFKPTPGQPSPLSGAFLTVNPLLSPEEAQENSLDPLLVKLNTQYDYSLFENKGKYTLVIATFSGKSSNFATAETEKSIVESFTLSNSLDEAASESFAMAEAMRKATKYGYAEDYEVFVWHDRYKSVVTVGSFDSPNDPEIRRLAQKYAAKQKQLQNNPGQFVLAAEYFSLPKVEDVTQSKKYWLFDPTPTVMKVPSLHR